MQRAIRLGREDSHLVAKDLSEYTLTPIEWLWPDRIAIGKLMVIAGHPGLAKSKLALFMAAMVTTGGEWPFGEGRAPKGRVLLLSAEDDPADTILPRLLAVGGDTSAIKVVEAVRSKGSERTFDLTADIEALDRELSDDDYLLVIIDPISAYLGTKIDSYNNTHIRAVLEPLKRLAERHRVAIVCVTHLVKAGGQSALASVNGSVAFGAVARTVLTVHKEMEEDDEGERRSRPGGASSLWRRTTSDRTVPTRRWCTTSRRAKSHRGSWRHTSTGTRRYR